MGKGLRWITWVVPVLLVSGCVAPQRQAGTLYQVSTLQGLMQGAFDGVVTFGELRRHGDTGIGTLNGLDGEMILLDSQAWQVRADGQVLPVADRQTTPFATAAVLRADQQVDVKGPMNMAQLGEALDKQLPTQNIFYLGRIDGRFHYVKTRSVPAQKPPYPLLLEASKQQSIFERHDVDGTLVVLRCPKFAKDINMAGWHMHFLASDRKFGGHVLDLQLDRATARITHLRQLEMVLPKQGRFVEADLTRSTAEQIQKVEQ